MLYVLAISTENYGELSSALELRSLCYCESKLKRNMEMSDIASSSRAGSGEENISQLHLHGARMVDMASHDPDILRTVVMPHIGRSSRAGAGAQNIHPLLLEAATSGDSKSMKHYACHNPDILHGTTPEGNTCLHISSIHGHQLFSMNVVTLEKSLLMVVNFNDETPLIAAVRSGHVSLASVLLRCCCQPAFRHAILQKDRYGFTALHHAIRNGHKNLAMELITAEPALSQAVGKSKDSPLFFAVMRSFTHICEKLMQNPSCAYSGGPDGHNCLHAAVKKGDKEIARQIMEKHPELASESGREICTPVRHAVKFGKTDILKLMLEHDSTLGYEVDTKGNPLLISAAYRGQVAAARELLKHCPDAPYNNIEGQTLLHVAVLYDHSEFVEFVMETPLLRKLVNVQDNKGQTALHCAVMKCNPRTVVALLSHKDIDVTVLDEKGDSPSWKLSSDMHNAKTLNWNEVVMLMSKAYPQMAASLHNLHVAAKRLVTNESRKSAKSLTQIYTSNTSLVAILMTTITFAAAFALPGGYSSAAGREGLPTMSQKAALKAFLISDTLAMCSSFAIAFICIIARWQDYEFLIYYRSFTRKLMWFAYVATTTAFSTGLYTVLATQLRWLAIIICVPVALLPISTWLLGNWPILTLRFRLGKSFRSGLLDMA